MCRTTLPGVPDVADNCIASTMTFVVPYMLELSLRDTPLQCSVITLTAFLMRLWLWSSTASLRMALDLGMLRLVGI